MPGREGRGVSYEGWLGEMKAGMRLQRGGTAVDTTLSKRLHEVSGLEGGRSFFQQRIKREDEAGVNRLIKCNILEREAGGSYLRDRETVLGGDCQLGHRNPGSLCMRGEGSMEPGEGGHHRLLVTGGVRRPLPAEVTGKQVSAGGKATSTTM